MSVEVITEGLAAHPGHAARTVSDGVVMATDMSKLHLNHHFLMISDSSSDVASQ